MFRYFPKACFQNFPTFLVIANRRLKDMKMILTSIFLIATLVSFSVSAEKVIAAGDPWPPFLDPDSSGNGLVFEIADLAFKTQGYKLEMEFVPWARAIRGVKEANYDVLLATWYTEERNGYLRYSEPYLENEIKFIQRLEDNFEYQGLASLTGKNVGIVRDYGYGDEFLNATNFKRAEANNLLQNVKKLVSGRIDLTLEDEIVSRAILKSRAPHMLQKIKFTKNSFSKKSLFLTSGRKNSRSKKLVEVFNRGIKEIKGNGGFDEIMKRYGF